MRLRQLVAIRLSLVGPLAFINLAIGPKATCAVQLSCAAEFLFDHVVGARGTAKPSALAVLLAGRPEARTAHRRPLGVPLAALYNPFRRRSVKSCIWSSS
jgi:hypothetical protein